MRYEEADTAPCTVPLSICRIFYYSIAFYTASYHKYECKASGRYCNATKIIPTTRNSRRSEIQIERLQSGLLSSLQRSNGSVGRQASWCSECHDFSLSTTDVLPRPSLLQDRNACESQSLSSAQALSNCEGQQVSRTFHRAVVFTFCFLLCFLFPSPSPSSYRYEAPNTPFSLAHSHTQRYPFPTL